MRTAALIFLIAALVLPAQQAPVELVNVGPGVAPPRLVRKVEPKYSKEALEIKLEGNVVLEVVVTDKGIPSQLRVLRPLGYGLDEEALAAVTQWRFEPGVRKGVPVNVMATVDVNFRLLKRAAPSPDPRRSQFMTAYRVVSQPKPEPAARDAAVRTILELSDGGLPEAQYVAGAWKMMGSPALAVAKDSAAGLALVRKAAEARHGSALYVLAMRVLLGEDPAGDRKTATLQMYEAARRGSFEAQYFLGAHYEDGNGVTKDLGKAEFYFRQCAYDRVPQCQYRLGRLLLAASSTRQDELVSAVAYLELAGEGGIPDARTPAANAKAQLTAEQQIRMARLKPMLVRR